MARTLSRHLNVGLIAALAVSAALAFYAMRGPGGVGGTGITDGPGGVGGTGIFGRIDGLGSIWVNGYEIHYDETLPLTYRGAIAGSENFAIGQVVAVVANNTNGDWHARTARIVEEVIGPIEIAADGVSVAVLEQKILFTEETIYAIDTRETLEPGSIVAVSGFRTPEGAILTTRIASAGPEAGLFVRGAVADLSRSGFSINDLGVVYDGLSLSEGDIVAVSGVLIDARFTAQDVQKDDAFEGYSVENISYQGVVDTTSPGSSLRVGEYFLDKISTTTTLRDEQAPALVVLNGRLEQSSPTIVIASDQLAPEPQKLRPAPEELRRLTGDDAEEVTEPEDTEPRASEPDGDSEQNDSATRDGSTVRDTTTASAVDERTLEDDRDQPETSESGADEQADTPERDSNEIDASDEVSRETDETSDEESPDLVDDPVPTERPEGDARPSQDRPSRPERPAQDRPERPERPQRPDR